MSISQFRILDLDITYSVFSNFLESSILGFDETKNLDGAEFRFLSPIAPTAGNPLGGSSIEKSDFDGNVDRREKETGLPISLLAPSPVSQVALAEASSIRVEAEDYVAYFDITVGNSGGSYRNDDVDIQPTRDTTGSYNVGWIQTGEWLDYEIEIPQAGEYELSLRVAALGSANKSISINGQLEVEFQATGGWQNWTTAIAAEPIVLASGTNTIRLEALSNSFNVNYLELSLIENLPTPQPMRLEAENFNLGGSYQANANGYIEIPGSDGATGQATRIFSGETGTYQLIIGYYDENDGASELSVKVGTQVVDTWLLDDITQGSQTQPPYDRVSPETFMTRTLSPAITVAAGDLIEVSAIRGDGEWARVDYLEFIPVAQSLRLEAEEFDLSGGYRVNAGGYIEVGGSDGTSGQATETFSGQADTYQFTIGYYDESDGESELSVKVNGQTIDTWILDDMTDGGSSTNAASPETFMTRTLSEAIALEPGDQIEIAGVHRQGEYARVDYLEFIPTNEDPIPPEPEDPLPPPEDPLPPGDSQVDIGGQLRVWHDVTLTVDGPFAKEQGGSVNPFSDYRFDVTFTKGNQTYVVPGYFAADGNAANTSATEGDRWRVHFAPPESGTWNYEINFQQGNNVAIASNPNAGTSVAGLDGLSGSFQVSSSNKGGDDFRGKGRLQYVGERYLQHAGSGEYFLKGGPGSPENFLGYYQFDNTTDYGGLSVDLIDGLHRYQPHVNDWNSGDPTWQGGKGKGIIGALNYLNSEDMNTIYMLTFNTSNGDGQEVFPWVSPNQQQQYDVSKLAQWEILFDHADKQGIALHLLTQETENDRALDGGALGNERKLYYRELIARFSHHLGITWNLGEENTNSDSQRQAFADYIRDLDPYDSHVVVHTYPGQKNAVYTPLLGNEDFTGAALQVSSPSAVNNSVLQWIDKSQASGQPWVVSLDEIGPATRGAVPDAIDPNHDEVRGPVLWGTLMAGGAGVEWYFGYNFDHNDLDAEDWRSRDELWDQTDHALDFFRNHLPYWRMESMDGITTATNDYVFGAVGDIYAVYLPKGGSTQIDLPQGDYSVSWYDPRNGGGLSNGSIAQISGGQNVPFGNAPNNTSQDWVALIEAI